MTELVAIRALVVCHDNRWKDLIAVLPAWDVYVRRWHDDLSEWRWECWNAGSAREVSDIDVPEEHDAAFLHLGDMPEALPAHLKIRVPFVFSGAGVTSRDACAVRPNAIPMRRPFTMGASPVRRWHVAEMETYIRDARPDVHPPTFCRDDEEASVLWTLAIACKTYAAAGIGGGVLRQDHPLVHALGWGPVWQIITLRARELAKLWGRVRLPEWWYQHLGFAPDGVVDESVRQRAVAALIMALHLDPLARENLGLEADADLQSQKSERMLAFLEGQQLRTTGGLTRLLRAAIITPDLVSGAYHDVAALLEDP